MKLHTQNLVKKLFPDLLIKKSKLSVSLDQLSKILYSFLLYAKLKVYQNILKLSW